MNLYNKVHARALSLYENINDLDNERLLAYISKELEEIIKEILRKASEK
jgi:hypothetical protein